MTTTFHIRERLGRHFRFRRDNWKLSSRILLIDDDIFTHDKSGYILSLYGIQRRSQFASYQPWRWFDWWWRTYCSLWPLFFERPGFSIRLLHSLWPGWARCPVLFKTWLNCTYIKFRKMLMNWVLDIKRKCRIVKFSIKEKHYCMQCKVKKYVFNGTSQNLASPPVLNEKSHWFKAQTANTNVKKTTFIIKTFKYIQHCTSLLSP